MKRALMAVVVVVGFGTTGCWASKSEVDSLEARLAALEAAHGQTRDKLQALLVWANHKNPPAVGLYDWMTAVHGKLWPSSGPTDPIKPAPPPPPF